MNKKTSLLVAAVSATMFAGQSHAFKFDAGDTKVDLGGYAKLDVSYNDPGYNISGTVAPAGTIKTVDKNADATIDMSARQSRFWLKTATPKGEGTLKTHVEFDLYGTAGTETVSNSSSLRLRHAYGSLNDILMGQTWSTFMDLYTLGEIIDFTQQTSAIFVRQAQVRYTIPMGSGKLSLAAENPSSYGTDKNTYPDLVAKYDYNSKTVHASAALMVRELKINNDDSKNATALSLNAKVKLGNGDDVRVQLNGGALGRYMGLAAHRGHEGAGSTFDAVDSYGASVAYRHVWAPGVRSTLMVSATKADNNVALAGVLDGSQSVHVNILWDVAPAVTLGVEVQHREVEFFDTTKADVKADRLQFSAKYGF
ncbi:MAG: DcaP family trimeric outer membrane transporter [Motiliproteus sp.]